MVKAPKGYRHRTRKVFRKDIRERGAVPPLSLLMINYKLGDKVHIVVNPAIHKGMPHRRYHGKTGVIVGKRGRAYIVKVYLGDKEKTLFVRPEHLRPASIKSS
jgi:large subunit ribosomal protein L21e